MDRGLARALHSGGDQRIGVFHYQGCSPERCYDFKYSALAVNELLEAPLYWFVIADPFRAANRGSLRVVKCLKII